MIRKLLSGMGASTALLALVGTPLSASAEFPEKPVEMIVAYSPGGGTDTAARAIAKYIEPYLGQRLAIRNMPGAGGQIGFTALARAEPNGYEIGFINIPSIMMVKRLRDNVPYEMSDFEPIANIQRDPAVLAVRADSPYNSAEDLLKAARENPGDITIGADGPQSNNQLQFVVFEDKTGVDFNFVSYDGSGPAIKATLGAEVAASLPSASSAAQHVESGRLRLLGVFSDETFGQFPKAPTVSESLGTDIPSIGASIRGIAAPKGISAEHKKVLEQAFLDVLDDPEFQKQAEAMGMPLKPMDSEDFAKFLESSSSDVARYIDMMKQQ